MAGGKGKSIGGKGAPGKDAAGKTQKSHSAKAGLQVSFIFVLFLLMRFQNMVIHYLSTVFAMLLLCDTDTVMKHLELSTFTRRVECACLFFVSPEQSLSRFIACIFVAFICRVHLSLIPKSVLLLLCRVKLNLTDAIEQFPCGRVKRFLKNNTQNKMRVGAKGTI